MSIALLAIASDGRADVYVPVAAHGWFERDWAPLSAELGLVIVPMLESPGVVVAHPDRARLTIGQEGLPNELETLREAAIRRGMTALAERVERLLETLRTLDRTVYTDIYVG